MAHKIPWLLLGLLSGLALAQDPSQEPDRRHNSAVITPSYHLSGIRGSLPRAGLYVMPHSSFGLDITNVDLVDANGFDFFDAWIHDLLTTRSDAMLQLNTPGLPFMMRGWLNQASFFGDPTAPNPRAGRRLQTGLTSRFRPHPATSFQLGYINDSFRQPTNSRIGLIDYGAQTFYGESALKVGPGVLQVRLEEQAFQSRMPGLASNRQTSWRLGYQAMLSHRSILGATAQWGDLNQAGVRSRMFAFGLTGQYQPAKNLWTAARFRYRNIDLRPTANAYTARTTGGSASLTWRPWQRTRLTLGGDYTAYQRLNAVQSAWEHPNQLKVWLRGDYRGPQSLRVIGEYQYRAVSNLPSSAVPLIGNASPLFADLEQRLSLRASATVGGSGVAYGFGQWRGQSFDARGMRRTIVNLGAGVSYPVTPRLQLTADLYYLNYKVNQAYLAGDDADGLVSHLGLAWQPDSVWRFWTDYHRSDSYFGENTDQGVASAGIAANLGEGREISVQYSRDDLTSRAWPGLGYDTDVLHFRYAQPF